MYFNFFVNLDRRIDIMVYDFLAFEEIVNSNFCKFILLFMQHKIYFTIFNVSAKLKN